MYRVELKALPWWRAGGSGWVPNVPCGVESPPSLSTYSTIAWFLMYRVELKVERTRGGERKLFGS